MFSNAGGKYAQRHMDLSLKCTNVFNWQTAGTHLVYCIDATVMPSCGAAFKSIY